MPVRMRPSPGVGTKRLLAKPMAPGIKPVRIERRVIHGQEVEVKIYPPLYDYLREHPPEPKRTLRRTRVLDDG